MKVNDKDGNPIEIAAVVVWKVVDTAEAAFEVDNFENYVHVQSESALRNLATAYPYDSHDRRSSFAPWDHGRGCGRLARGDTRALDQSGCGGDRVAHQPPRLCGGDCGGHASETAGVGDHRGLTKIVEGAVGMVEMALDRLSANKVVELDEERRATMVSNLLVVLCGERAAQPVLNAGTLY